MTSWDGLWAVVGKPLPVTGLPHVIQNAMKAIEETSDASIIYQCVSGYEASTAGSGVDAARIIYTYYNQLTPPLMDHSVVVTLCGAPMSWQGILEVLQSLPAHHYAALYVLLRHCYCISVNHNVTPDLLAAYYYRSIFKSKHEPLRSLLSNLIMNFLMLHAPQIGGVDSALVPMISEVVSGFLSGAAKPYSNSPLPEEMSAQEERVERTFGPLLEISPLSTTTMAPPLVGGGVAAPPGEDLLATILRHLPTMTSISTMTEPQLRSAKRVLKHRIHSWEESFQRLTGHMPMAVDKQPVRLAYDAYKNLKLRLEALSAEMGLASGPPSEPPPPPPPTTLPTTPHVAQLREEKHKLKRQLHEFESSIRLQYGRAPTREDRKRMLQEYARYGELKAMLQ